MGRMQREKGKRVERMLVAKLAAHGFSARRGQQHKGTPDSPDVECEDLPFIHWESKGCEQLRAYQYLEKAEEDSGSDQVPVVAYKRNGSDFLAILDLDDFLFLMEQLRELSEGARAPKETDDE